MGQSTPGDTAVPGTPARLMSPCMPAWHGRHVHMILGEAIMSYEIMYGSMLTRIDVWSTDGRHVRTVYVHRSEYRTWGA